MQFKPSKIINNYIIIGSGFSAAAAVSILIKKKIKPVVVDIGRKKFTINNEDRKKLPLGISFNNSFNSLTGFKNTKNTELLESSSFGGLSRIWGGIINKIQRNEADSWPIKIKTLEKYYKHVDNFFFHLGFNDNYSKFFNLKKPDIYIRDNRNNFFLKKQNKTIFFGNSREAVDFKKNSFELNKYFSDLIKKKKIYYIKNFEVKKIEENSKSIFIFSKNRYLACKKLYVASGPLATAKILLNSFKSIKKISLKETSLILSFWFVKKKINNYDSDRNCDFFLTKISKPFFSSQIYILKDCLIKKIFKKNTYISLLLSFVLRFFKNKFIITLSYLDECQSSKIILEKINNKIFIKSIPVSVNFYSKVIKTLKSFFLNKIFLIFSIKKKFGYGYHFGSSYPMSKKKKLKFSDILGRVNNLRNVHIIDSSILPRIPISTITYTIMANAARIVDKTSIK